MIKTVNLQKIFKTEEVETWALNNVNLEIKAGHPPEAVVETSHPLLANVPARVHSIIFRSAAGHSVPKE